MIHALAQLMPITENAGPEFFAFDKPALTSLGSEITSELVGLAK